MANPLSRREVLKYGAFTTVGGVLTPGISLAQAITTESRGLTARDIQLQSETPLTIHLDGEFFSQPADDVRTVHIRILPKALRVYRLDGVKQHE